MVKVVLLARPIQNIIINENSNHYGNDRRGYELKMAVLGCSFIYKRLLVTKLGKILIELARDILLQTVAWTFSKISKPINYKQNVYKPWSYTRLKFTVYDDILCFGSTRCESIQNGRRGLQGRRIRADKTSGHFRKPQKLARIASAPSAFSEAPRRSTSAGAARGMRTSAPTAAGRDAKRVGAMPRRMPAPSLRRRQNAADEEGADTAGKRTFVWRRRFRFGGLILVKNKAGLVGILFAIYFISQ